jgi:hypothetical protein
MNLLTEFRGSYQDLLLSFLWRQWSALGVAGYGASDDKWFIDPEALLILSCSMARYDARLFDEILDWLDTNGSFINIQRLKTIMKEEQFVGEKVISAIAAVIGDRRKFSKWARLSQRTEPLDIKEDLFLRKNGEPIELFGKPESIFDQYGFRRGRLEFRGHTQPARIVQNTGFLFKLRALFGVNARCEIVLYLLTHESAHPRKIARETYYYQKTVQDRLVEMTRSGLVFVRPAGKEKRYWLKREKWFDFLADDVNKEIQWVNWPSLLSALEEIWLRLNRKDLANMDSLVQSSELRLLMQRVRPRIEAAGFASSLSDDRLYLGESYISAFLSDIKRILG